MPVSYRTDDDRTDERIGKLRDELAHRLDQLEQLDRERARLTGEKRRRPRVVPERNAITDEDRLALLNHALDQLQTEILVQRRENEELQRIQTEKAKDKSNKVWFGLFKLLFKIGRKL